jgi:hypothetical protein
MISAWELHQRLPASQLRIIADAGHAGLLLEPQQRDMPLSLDLFICHCALPAHARANPPTHRRTCTHHSIPSRGLTATSGLILTAGCLAMLAHAPFLRFRDSVTPSGLEVRGTRMFRACATGNEPGILRELVKATDSFRPAA